MENLRISTITSVAELNTHIDLDLLYKGVEIDDKIKYIEKGDLPPRGEPTKKKRKSRNNKKNSVFFNQAIAAFRGWIDSRNDPTKALRLGNNRPIDAAALTAIAAEADRLR